MFKEKKVLIIGGTGTIGSELTRKILNLGADTVRIFSRDEFKQFNMMRTSFYEKNKFRLRFLLGDIRDYNRLLKAMEDIDIVFNLAAMKHVGACEYNPFEAVKTNVIGTQNVIEAALNQNVEMVIYSSTDKTTSPVNTYGATKLLAEKLMESANYTKGGKRTIFACVRFGNVIGSRGSVIPLFEKQIVDEKRVTITESSMTRFMMTIDQATDLLMKACTYITGGEICILKMPTLILENLVDAVIHIVCNKNNIDTNDVHKEVIGLRKGEKMYESLMTSEEAEKAIEYDDMYVLLSDLNRDSDIRKKENARPDIDEYRSDAQEHMTYKELKEMLIRSGVFGE